MFKCLNVKMKRGFTLIEMLVAITIFGLVVGSAIGLFVSAIRSQAKALASQKLLDETSYVMEYMSRALRMTKKEMAAPACLSQNGLNYEIPSGFQIGPNLGSAVRFINSTENNECQAYYLEFMGTHLIVEKPEFLPFVPHLTSDAVKVSSLQFNLSGASQTDNLQPRVTISMTIRKAGATAPEIKIQTTISQRNLDIQ